MAKLYGILAVAGWVWTVLVLIFVGLRWNFGPSHGTTSTVAKGDEPI